MKIKFHLCPETGLYVFEEGGLQLTPTGLLAIHPLKILMLKALSDSETLSHQAVSTFLEPYHVGNDHYCVPYPEGLDLQRVFGADLTLDELIERAIASVESNAKYIQELEAQVCSLKDDVEHLEEEIESLKEEIEDLG